MVWYPSQIEARSWPKVVEFYRHLEDRNDDFRPMRILAEHIAAQPYAACMIGAISGTALLVTRDPPAGWPQGGLRVDVNLSGRVRFVIGGRGSAKASGFAHEGSSVVSVFDDLVRKGK